MESIKENGYVESVIYNHINKRKKVHYLVNLVNIKNSSAEREIFDKKYFGVDIVKKAYVLCIKQEAGLFYYLKKR